MLTYALNTTVEPTQEPITLEQAKKHLRVPHSNEDANIERIYIPAARKRIESQTSRRLITQTLELSLDAWPAERCIFLPVAPVQSVTSIQYVDTAGAQQTLDASEYVVSTRHEPARIVQKFGSVWPTVRQREQAATVLVTFVAGYGARSDVPDPLREAMLLLVSHYYYHREDVVFGNAKPLPMGVRDLLASESFGDEFQPYGVA